MVRPLLFLSNVSADFAPDLFVFSVMIFNNTFPCVSLFPPPQSSGGQSNQRRGEGSLSRSPTAGETVSTPSLPPTTAGLGLFKFTTVQYNAIL